MKIRIVSPADYDQWIQLWKSYQSFYKTTIPDKVTKQTWGRFLDPAETMHCAVAEINATLVGMAHYICHRSCWTEGDYIYLQDLFVESSSRDRGIGRALIEHVYAFAANKTASRVWWLTHESNEQAKHLYDHVAENSGFVQYRKILQ